MNYNHIVINIDELLLKGRNQNFFQQKLENHLRYILKTLHQDSFTFIRETRRIIIQTTTPLKEEFVTRLEQIAGIHSFVLAHQVDLKIEQSWQENIAQILPLIKDEVSSFLQNENEDEDENESKNISKTKKSFKVVSKRSNKEFSLNSMELSRYLGQFILQHFPDQLKVNLHQPDLTLEIIITEKSLYVSSRKKFAIGGLPVGSSGHFLTLLSGGFDSPVASYLMTKRGVAQSFVFFYAYPFVGDEVKKKILKIAQVLASFQLKPKLYILPFGKIQKKISQACDPTYRTLFFRYYMMKVSTMLADEVAAEALITGDSLGQVSSQTIGNMRLMNESTSLPIIRPLIGLNKSEIINLSRTVGTHDLSLIPHDDACSLFASKYPVTDPHAPYVKNILHQLETSIAEDLQECVSKKEIYLLTPQKIEKLQ